MPGIFPPKRYSVIQPFGTRGIANAWCNELIPRRRAKPPKSHNVAVRLYGFFALTTCSIDLPRNLADGARVLISVAIRVSGTCVTTTRFSAHWEARVPF